MFRKIIRWLTKSSKSPKIVLHSDETSWANVGQVGELSYHVHNEWRNSEAFVSDNAALFEHLGYSPDQFAGKVIVDLGAGSRLRSKYFKDARIFAIEPLANDFLEKIDWCDLNDAEKVFSLPAEKVVRELVGNVDFLMSINVLDHCYNFLEIVSAISQYVKKDGKALLSFDLHDETDPLHPLKLDEDTVLSAFQDAGFTIDRYDYGLGVIGENYGHGRAINLHMTRQ